MPEKEKRLTAKQTKLINGLAHGENLTTAAVNAGYGTNRQSAAAIACETLKNPNVSRALDAALDKAGATLDDSAKVIADAHKASNRNMPDHQTRLKAAEINLKARRLIGQSDSAVVQNNFIGVDAFEEFCRAYHKTRPQSQA